MAYTLELPSAESVLERVMSCFLALDRTLPNKSAIFRFDLARHLAIALQVFLSLLHTRTLNTAAIIKMRILRESEVLREQ